MRRTAIPLTVKTDSTQLALFLNSLRAGGAERIMVTIANAIAARGYSVDLVLSRAHGPFLSCVSPGVRLVDLGTSGVCRGALRLRSYLERQRPPVLLSTNMIMNVASVIVGKLAGSGTRAFLREGSTLSRDLAHQKRHPRRAVRWAARAVPFAYPRAEGVIAVSKGAGRDLVDNFGVPPEKLHVIYNPVIDNNHGPAAGNRPVPHRWLNDNIPVLLAAGRLTEAKDYPTLLRAFAAVRRRRPARLVILGEGEERSKLEGLARSLGISDEVDFPGFVNNPRDYLERANLFVMSSAWEGLPGSLIQALDCGCPAVSTDCPSGPAEILDNGRYGRLVEVGNAEQLSGAILEALAGDTKSVERSWLDRFTVASAVRQYNEVLGLGEPAGARGKEGG